MNYITDRDGQATTDEGEKFIKTGMNLYLIEIEAVSLVLKPLRKDVL